MKKVEIIERHSEEEYARQMQLNSEWHRVHPQEMQQYRDKWNTANPEKNRQSQQDWAERNPEKVKQLYRDQSCKGGKGYEHMLEYQRTGLRGERSKVRSKHRWKWLPYKQIIAPESQIHHEWIPETANYRGVALVEKDQHMHGIIDVIHILEGEITLLTEVEIRNNEEMSE